MTLENILGETGESNIQGERVKKLGEFAHIESIAVRRRGVSCAGAGYIIYGSSTMLV